MWEYAFAFISEAALDGYNGWSHLNDLRQNHALKRPDVVTFGSSHRLQALPYASPTYLALIDIIP